MNEREADSQWLDDEPTDGGYGGVIQGWQLGDELWYADHLTRRQRIADNITGFLGCIVLCGKDIVMWPINRMRRIYE